ncbi:hypothetical protein HMH01_00095 [Halovulum dunhuangense]|uniref:Uncharacterized protein n=1 Tax=Halovulum dunhuangense TaxID=1505036 RepID=A0A849KP67_9RHOB|nr:hypothetical protein [Halovulum dunhuangense]NNU78823.1 hypothetical protein [Halovulum dunhuangense]
MTPRNPGPGQHAEAAALRLVGVLALLGATGWLLLSDYHPLTLAVLIAAYFVGYVALRLMWFLDGNRLTPRGLQVGLGWALTGFNPETEEYDIRPVRVYFLLLALLAAGLFLRPIARWIAA